MKIVPYLEVAASDWNHVCTMSDDAWLFHRHEWIEIEAVRHIERNLSFAVLDGSRLVAVQPLYLRNYNFAGWPEHLVDSGFHRHTGLALLPGLSTGDRAAIRAAVMHEIFAVADACGADRIQLNSHNAAPANLRASREEVPFWVTNYNFYLGLNWGPNDCVPVPGMATCNADQIVELLSKSEGEIFTTFDEACRRAVRKALKSGLELELDQSIADVENYYQLAGLSAARTGESLPALEYYISIYEALRKDGRCRLLFAVHNNHRVGGLFLLLDKKVANFMSAASDPAYLPMRVNDFMHWEAIRWAKLEGYHHYRLGPIFPELPTGWPISRVSRFKGKFGGKSVPIIQGSCFLQPKKYLASAKHAVESRCILAKACDSVSDQASNSSFSSEVIAAVGMYGLLPVRGINLSELIIGVENDNYGRGQCLYEKSALSVYRQKKGRLDFFKKDIPSYMALNPHHALSKSHDGELLRDEEGATPLSLINLNGDTRLFVGLDIREDFFRFRQGDPSKVATAQYKGGVGFDYERPCYLYEGQIHHQHRDEPWVDNLGYAIAQQLSRLTGIPLVEPLPSGLKGLVIITGDDDQADLENYDKQLAILDGMPVTYFMHYLTRHTKETLAKLPTCVEIGVHPDALETPESYDRLCAEQTEFVRTISGADVRVVRNHGYLSDGYWGHLKTWEKCGLEFDMNLPGVDGTALNGSFMPFKVRRPDGTWSDHYSLLTAFGDGMVFALGMSDKQAARRIRMVARQIERRNPGVLVFNLHPQNVEKTRLMHEEVVRLAGRKGWGAMTAGSYLRWLRKFETLSIEMCADGCTLCTTSEEPMEGVVLKIPTGKASWKRKELGTWHGSVKVSF